MTANMKRTIALIFMLSFLTSSVIMTASAQSIPHPAVPQFSIRMVDYSYDTPTTYTTDPYSGKQVANPGYHVDDIRVEVKIKNQPFTPYTIPNPNATGNYDSDLGIEFYYNISFRGHFGTEWRQLDGTEDVDYPKQNYGSEYTSFNLSRNNAVEFRDGDQVDVRVKAIIGYETWGFVGTWPYRILNGEDSGWSQTLTITISKDPSSDNTYASTIDGSLYPTLTTPQTTPTSTTSPAPTPTVPEFPVLAILPLLVLMPLVITGYMRRKRSQHS